MECEVGAGEIEIEMGDGERKWGTGYSAAQTSVAESERAAEFCNGKGRSIFSSLNKNSLCSFSYS